MRGPILTAAAWLVIVGCWISVAGCAGLAGPAAYEHRWISACLYVGAALGFAFGAWLFREALRVTPRAPRRVSIRVTPHPLARLARPLVAAYHALRLCPRCRSGERWQRSTGVHSPTSNVKLALGTLPRRRALDGARR